MKTEALILGITDIHGHTHDNSIALLDKGKILFAASEERYSKIKHDNSFPKLAIQASLKYLRIKSSTIGTIAVGYPKRKIISVLSHKYFYEIIPFVLSIMVNRHLRFFIDLFPLITILYKKTFKNRDYKILQNKSSLFSDENKASLLLRNRKIIYVDHHLSHAASAYYTSGFNKCISIALDAFGPQLSGNIRAGAVFLCDQGKMKEVDSVPIFTSLGLFYTSVTLALGFKPGDGEGKTMGLAAYGNSNKASLLFRNKLYKILKLYSPKFKDHQWWPGKDWLAGMLSTIPKIDYLFHFTSFGKLLSKLLGKASKEDIAAAAQKILEEELINFVKYLIKKYPGYHNLCLSGGVFLNVKANKKILELSGVKKIFIHPNAGDGGTALGAALIVTLQKYLKKIINQPLTNCGLGESFTDTQILKILKKYGDKIAYRKWDNIIKYTVDSLLKEKVVGWFQGRSEWGPRALGFRSVLADPRNIKIKDRINKVLKNREWFMPFAPSVLEGKKNLYFKNPHTSPFMTVIFDVIPKKAKLFPATIHVDNSSRPQFVSKDNNPFYYELLKAWYRKTGLPILLNTSFNRHGLPIINSPEDAVNHLMIGAVDELIIGNFSVTLNKASLLLRNK